MAYAPQLRMTGMEAKLVHTKQIHPAQLLNMTATEVRQEVIKKRLQAITLTIDTETKQAAIKKTQADIQAMISMETKQARIKRIQTEQQRAMINTAIKQVHLKLIHQAERLSMINTDIKSEVTNNCIFTLKKETPNI